MSIVPATTAAERARRMRLGPAETKVFLVSDDARERAATHALLAQDDGLRVVGESAVAEAPGAVARTSPEVAVVHHCPRGPAAHRHIAPILIAAARVRVIVVTSLRDPAALLEALAAGASGYLLDDQIDDRLPHAVHAVMDGRVPIDPSFVAVTRERLGRLEELERRLREERSERSERAAEQPEPHSLTARELMVLRHVAAGLTNEGIAAELVISPGTAKQHVQHIIAKLGVANRTQAAVYAARHGLL
jgi:DNA-binding NarL/FixJ family response regulator